MKTLITLLLMLTISAYSQDVYTAIMEVESNNNPAAVGDNGRAVGICQLWKIYVDDVNRISGKDYTYADRLDPAKSVEMMKIYVEHYARRYERITGKPATDEVKARIHNGGPNGWKKACTVKYWNKVKKAMEK